MRNELEILAAIDEFLDEKISKEDLIQRVGSTSDLDAQIEVQQFLRKAIQKEAFIIKSKKALARRRFIVRAKWMAFILTIILIGVVGYVLSSKSGTPEFNSVSAVTDSTFNAIENKVAMIDSSTLRKEVVDQEQPNKIESPNLNIDTLNQDLQPSPTNQDVNAHLIQFKTMQFHTKERAYAKILSVYSKSINALELVFDASGFDLTKESVEDFHVELWNENKEDVLGKYFNEQKTKDSGFSGAQKLNYFWFIQYSSQLPKGNYQVRVYKLDQLLASKSFQVY